MLLSFQNFPHRTVAHQGKASNHLMAPRTASVHYSTGHCVQQYRCTAHKVFPHERNSATLPFNLVVADLLSSGPVWKFSPALPFLRSLHAKVGYRSYSFPLLFCACPELLSLRGQTCLALWQTGVDRIWAREVPGLFNRHLAIIMAITLC